MNIQNFFNKISKTNRANNRFIYPGEVYIYEFEGDDLYDVPTDERPGERCGYAVSDDGRFHFAVNEPNGWLLDHTINFDLAFNAYIKGRKSIEEVTAKVAAECGICPDDKSEWAEDLRTIIKWYIYHYDEYLDSEIFLNGEIRGNLARINEEMSAFLFSALILLCFADDLASELPESLALSPYTYTGV